VARDLIFPLRLSIPNTVLAILLVCCTPKRPGSIGAVVSRDGRTGAVHVRQTPPDQAAAKAGLIPGDRIKMIDGKLVDPLATGQLLSLLRGPIGSTVGLTVLRGRRVLHLRLERGPLAGADRVAPYLDTLKN
jgi:C-terminal processing protease CtpA/Prc